MPMRCLIHLFTYKTLKPLNGYIFHNRCLIHLFTYKTLKHQQYFPDLLFCLIHLFTYKTLKPILRIEMLISV